MLFGTGVVGRSYDKSVVSGEAAALRGEDCLVGSRIFRHGEQCLEATA